jgi:hypothetical protein
MSRLGFLGQALLLAIALPLRAAQYRAATLIAFSLALGTLTAGQSVLQKHLGRVDWQPTQAIHGARYAGREVCAQCHTREATEQESSAMAHALQLPSRSNFLELHPRLTFNNGPYRYTIEKNGEGVSYAVTDGVQSISVPVAWAFGYGMGQVGQTYLLSYNGSYYESRVTFFSGIDRLDVTLGHPTTEPASLVDALGREVKPEELRACFGCHSTGALSEGHLQFDQLVPGITCEGCHGPGAAHVAAMQAGNSKQTHIFNPA